MNGYFYHQHALSVYPMASPPATALPTLQPVSSDTFRPVTGPTAHTAATGFPTPYLITHPTSPFPMADVKISPPSSLHPQSSDPYAVSQSQPQQQPLMHPMDSGRARRRKTQHVDEGDPGRVSANLTHRSDHSQHLLCCATMRHCLKFAC